MSSTETPAGSRVPAPSNLLLWLAFAAAQLGVGLFFLVRVHQDASLDFFFGLGALFLRTLLFLAAGLFLEALLLRTAEGYLASTPARRITLHAFWIVMMFGTVATVADFFVFAFAGYHISTAFRILFADGPAGVGTVVEAAGLSLTRVLLALVGLAACLAAAIVLSRLSRRHSARWGVRVSRRAAMRTIFVAGGALALLELLAFHVRDPFRWEKEVASIPLAFSVVRPEAELASFRVSLRPPRQAAVPTALSVPERRPDIFIVVIESLRGDVLTPTIMPNLARFAAEGITFHRAITSGNVTHYSWFGLFSGEAPIHFDAAKAAAVHPGAQPIALLRRAGWRVRLWATPDTGYQSLESIVFGDRGSLLDSKFHPTDPKPAQRDHKVVSALTGHLRKARPGGEMHVVALDSTHFEYDWGTSFSPPFTPYAQSVSMVTNYHSDPMARRELINRYHNSARWMDSLLAGLFSTLESTGRMKDSIIVITGDHGEAFWENGAATHGANLGREQLDVAFALRLPGVAAERRAEVFSLMDVMPTVLQAAGVQPPVPLRPALTFQGWNERAFRFAVTLPDRRAHFALNAADPRKAGRLTLLDVTSLDDRSLVRESDDPAAYADFLRNLPAFIDAMPFLEFQAREPQ